MTHVIMNVDRPNGSGGTYKAGVEYDLPDDLAALWRGQGVCRLTSVRSEQTGAVVSAIGGNFPDAPALNKRIPLEVVSNGDGEIRFSEANGALKLFQQRKTAFQLQGKAAISGTANASRHLAAVMPFRWYGVQAKVLNGSDTVRPTYNVGIATADNITDPTLNSEAWSVFKWGGSPDVVPPLAIGATQGIQTMGESDWSDPLIGAPKVYGNGTVMGLRSWADVAGNTWFDHDPECALTTTLDVQGYYIAWKASANCVLTPSTFLSPQRSPAAGPPVLLRFLTAAMVKVHLLVGSSTTGGRGDTTDMGWAVRTQRVLNSLGGMAYHFVNYSHGGAPTTGNDLRLAQIIDDVNPDTVTINLFTLNDADRATAAGLARLKSRVDSFIEMCKSRGIPPSGRILMEWQHPTGSTGGEYENAKAINAYARAKAAAGEAVAFGVAAALSDETASVGTWKTPSDTTDGTHPNSQGHGKIVPIALPIYG